MPNSFDCSETRMLLLLLCFLVKIEGKYPLSISAYALSSVIFSPSLLSSRPILPFAALLLFVYFTLLIPFTTFTNQYLILCLCLFWFCPFMSSYSHLLTPAFLLIHFLWLPFHPPAFRKPLVQVQYIDLLLFHILVLSKIASAVVHWVFLFFRNFPKASSGFFRSFPDTQPQWKAIFPYFSAQLQGGLENATNEPILFSWKAGIIWNMHNLIRIVRFFLKTLITSLILTKIARGHMTTNPTAGLLNSCDWD